MSRVLVVEDEAHLADGLRFNLEAEGHSVEVSGDGEDAIDRLLGRRKNSTPSCSTSCSPAWTVSPSPPPCARRKITFPC